MGDSPIRGNSFSFCEHSCDMDNETKVIGMDAYLYDVSCRGDNGSFSSRMMFVRFQDPGPDDLGMMITTSGASPLYMCE